MKAFFTRLGWDRMLTGGLFLAGLALWGIFLNWGDIPYFYLDWAEVNMPRLAVVQNSLQRGLLPLFSASTDLLRCGCDRYFSVPDVLATPTLLLLRWMPIGLWVLGHIWLMYAAGFWGLLKLRRRFQLSFPLFLILFGLVFFNGHIVSHLAAGHLTWGGYFLFPWLVYLVERFLQGDDSWGWTLQVALLFFATFLQGSYHQFVWGLLFLGFLALANLRRFWTLLRTALAIGLVSAFRLLPPALALGKLSHEFLGGYPDWFSLYKALTYPVEPSGAMPFQALASNLGFWEFDLYVGKLGLAVLLLAGLAWAAQQARERRPARVLLPIAALALLSYGDVYSLVRWLPIPLLNGERVSARILSLPFVFFAVYAIAALQDWAARWPRLRWPLAGGLLLAGLSLLFSQARHLLAWQVTRSSQVFPYVYTELSAKLPASHPDPLYIALLGGGLALSLLSIAGLAWISRRRPNGSTPTLQGRAKASKQKID